MVDQVANRNFPASHCLYMLHIVHCINNYLKFSKKDGITDGYNQLLVNLLFTFYRINGIIWNIMELITNRPIPI